MKNIFITGITGLLGGNLAIDLLQKGYRVKAILRNKNAYKGITHPNLELIQGNLNDDLTPHLLGIDVFVHTAAETSQNLMKYTAYRTINFEATKHLFLNSVECGVKKFIFVSTANTVGFGSLKNPGDENSPIREPFTKSLYAKSKLEAENYLLSQQDKMNIIVIHPTFMLGAYDNKPSSGKIILFGLRKKLLFFPPGGKNFVHVKDVSQGIINSIELRVKDNNYLIANENLTYKAFFTKLNSIAGQKPVLIKIPKTILISLGYLGDFLRYCNIKTSISSTNMKTLCINNYYSNEKSKKKLNLHYAKIDTAILDAVTFFKKQSNG
ncbi:NAD-dependent epimerase/dehydratase family protein [Marixanthomonas spongiae]|uniref:Dihydroflavonol 4-reductase n=1 Tax=Marixanthomonas spongiae TaxID=2174845 RepID=A0A2U0I490_9FLAO|nr:NAD-dependent epimerase/dehydratase family protein [Marixanthomonas spongiae]PVW15810.1 dihydroflavonol 4-reductase [Marixanthomonas spongiae]